MQSYRHHPMLMHGSENALNLAEIWFLIWLTGQEAEKVFNDAQDMLKKLVDKKLLKARAVVGLYPAQSVGDDIHVYADDKAAREGNTEAVFYGLRQQVTTSRT